ncbi:MAG TPA: spore coat U domain-containing protein [Alphaproteobacteria bacterium]|nr:spore coat U domain-containing protein [Alphaproteobacteria bacterium]
MRHAVTRWAAAIAAALLALVALDGGERGLAAPKQCTVTATPVRFGTYLPFASADTLANGAVSYSCTASTPVVITLDRGSSGSYNPRTMRQGASLLAYNLYLDPPNKLIWGDGTGGTGFYTNATPPPNTTITLGVYGRIPAQQHAVRPGTYMDTITVQVQF